MLEGLEISEVRLRDIFADNLEFRIDSDFFEKRFVANTNKLKTKPHNKLVELVSDIKSFGAYSLCNYINFVNEGIPFIRCLNIKNGIIDFKDVLYIDEASNDLLHKSEVRPRMVLVTMSGTVGNSSIALEHWQYPMNTNQDVAKITTKSVNPFYLSTFLNTKFGLLQMQRFQAGAIQQHLYLSQIEKLIIPAFSDAFQEFIEKIITIAHNKIEHGNLIFNKAKEALWVQLKLNTWKPSAENKIIKKFSQSFAITGRFDSEFYMPYFEEVENLLKTTFGFETVEQICSDINYGTVPTSPYTEDETGIPYIKGTNFKNTIIDSEGLDRLINTEELDERFFTQKGDIIISQMGTVGDTGVVEEHQIGWLFASFTIRIRIKDKKNFDPHFVAFYIQHIAKPYYLHRYIAQASVRQNTDLPTIKNMYIPKVPIEKQKEISKQIQNSFALRRKSSELLEAAKAAVEIAIEQDEKKAMEYLRRFLD